MSRTRARAPVAGCDYYSSHLTIRCVNSAIFITNPSGESLCSIYAHLYVHIILSGTVRCGSRSHLDQTTPPLYHITLRYVTLRCIVLRSHLLGYEMCRYVSNVWRLVEDLEEPASKGRPYVPKLYYAFVRVHGRLSSPGLNGVAWNNSWAGLYFLLVLLSSLVLAQLFVGVVFSMYTFLNLTQSGNRMTSLKQVRLLTAGMRTRATSRIGFRRM